MEQVPIADRDLRDRTMTPCPLTVAALIAALAANAGPATAEQSASHHAVGRLAEHLAMADAARPSLPKQQFAVVPLTRDDAEEARNLLWRDKVTGSTGRTRPHCRGWPNTRATRSLRRSSGVRTM